MYISSRSVSAAARSPMQQSARFDPQAGFSLVEVSIVMAIVLLLAIIAIPTVQAYVIEGKVPKVGEEIARFMLHTRVNATGAPAAPYDGIGTDHLANMMRDSSVFSVTGSSTAAVVYHGLGGKGEVTVTESAAGAAFAVTLSDVNHAACPSLASVLQRVSDVIELTPGSGSSVVLKDATTPYSALATESHCAQGDDNTFVFTAS